MKVITAAGVVALDPRRHKEPRVLLVHRPAYDDWSLPKGKVEPDEPLPATAVRETLEETGVSVRLDHPLGTIRYRVGGGPKVVHYWRASPLTSLKRKPDKEVDRAVWLTARAALARMTYADERAMLERTLPLPPTTPVLIVRHAKAMDRKHWTGRDQARPISSRGRKQARDLVSLLGAFGVQQLESSSSVRCVQTLRPYAKERGLDVYGWSTLTEELAQDNERAVSKLMRQLLDGASKAQTPTAICGHRPVLPTMLDAAGIGVHPMQTGAVAIAHLDAHGATVATEWHRPLH